MHRSYLFAPGHNAKLVDRVFTAGADAVMLDLEDAVPPDAKAQARRMVVDALGKRPAWVRINALRSDVAAADLDGVVPLAAGLRLPKVEAPEDVRWVVDRCGPDGPPLICAIESARGLLAAHEIASVGGVRHLSIGGVDLRRELNTGDGDLPLLHARAHLVVVSRAAGLASPIDSVYPHVADDDGLRAQCAFARSLGFFGKSAIHPRQLPALHAVFTPSADEIAWAHEVIEAFTAAGEVATRLGNGEFVDRPVADRARRLLTLATRREPTRPARPREAAG
jgi:citrate lyase subunit beta / citryl-CoA lyase